MKPVKRAVSSLIAGQVLLIRDLRNKYQKRVWDDVAGAGTASGMGSIWVNPMPDNVAKMKPVKESLYDVPVRHPLYLQIQDSKATDLIWARVEYPVWKRTVPVRLTLREHMEKPK